VAPVETVILAMVDSRAASPFEPAAAAPERDSVPTPPPERPIAQPIRVEAAADVRREPVLPQPEPPRPVPPAVTVRQDATPTAADLQAPARGSRKASRRRAAVDIDEDDLEPERAPRSFARLVARIIVIPLYLIVGALSIGIIAVFLKDLLGF
jgi:hypothetical protein